MKSVDISEKPVQRRVAVAEGHIRLRPETLKLIAEGGVEKGDPLKAAELSAVQAVKRTAEAIIFCHPIPIEQVAAEASLDETGVKVVVEVKSTAKTGVEMEALYGVSVALLNVWDMVKKYEKDERGQYPYTAIDYIRVLRKEKGKVQAGSNR